MHWLSGCIRLDATEYLKTNNNVLMILCVALEIQEGLLGKIRNSSKEGGRIEQSLRMTNVCYAGTSNITYVKQQQ